MKPVVKTASRFLSALYDVLISVKLAVLVIVSLLVSLIVATCLESIYDTRTAQYLVYQTTWFIAILGALGLNIFFVAVSRLPWKKKHTAFLLAHAGILMLLFGSFLTQRFGIDGSLRLDEGETSSIVDLGQPVFIVAEGASVKQVLVPWTPPDDVSGLTKKRFKPVEVPGYPLAVTEFLPHAEGEVKFVPAASQVGPAKPAIKLKLRGGPMQIEQEFWLWAGGPEWAQIQAGPARLELKTPEFARASPNPPGMPKGASPEGPIFRVSGNAREIQFESLRGNTLIKKGAVAISSLPTKPMDSGWRGGVQIELLEWIPNAESLTQYIPSQTQYGQSAPPSAIKVEAVLPPPSADDVATPVTPAFPTMWLGLGDRMMIEVDGKQVLIGYTTTRILLPFSIKLDHFEIERYLGTNDPKGYASRVRVATAQGFTPPTLISMNEPLHHDGITFYQASYEEAKPRPTVSILSVNRDPGRWWKYIGSLLLVTGSILMFAKYYLKRRVP